ncbi:hypothetical protein [Caldanaerobacter sp.]|uniref:hypothetical protein n=1 Tax=Caldanaerobacter sp. TaxID=2930036 RepID=UPI003C70F496
MKKTCPLLNVECRRERCAFYSEKYKSCAILLLAETEAGWQNEIQEEIREVKEMYNTFKKTERDK